MLCASKHLQEPFVFHASDTIILGQEKIPKPNVNWVAGSKGESAAQYASFDISSDVVMNFHEKGMMEFDYLHVGLIGIKDYKKFWKTLGTIYELNTDDSSLNDLSVLRRMKSEGTQFKFEEVFNWVDVGNAESLLKARKQVGQKFEVLEKTDESISFVNDSVIKFFGNLSTATNRVDRANALEGLVPKITNSSGNFYRYPFVDGVLASHKTTPNMIRELLSWSKKNLWITRNNLQEQEFHKICKEFYQIKTTERIKMFLEKTKFDEVNQVINGVKIPSIYDLLDRLDFNSISKGIQTQFHGDFILDNIIKIESGFKLIDWRQDFGGQIKSGDIYYDLAKLNHSLIINHEIVNLNYFDITLNENEAHCEIYRKHDLVESTKVLREFLEKENLDYGKVQILTALIWLNMSPLHHHPFDLFLFNFGKLSLWRSLESE
jgi:hypothetical protein